VNTTAHTEANRRILIGGEWLEATDGRTLETVDPATGELLARVPRGGEAEAAAAVDAARAAHDAWRSTIPADRGRLLLAFASAIRESAEALARIETLDTGKPLKQARGDVQVAARYFEFYAGLADKLLGTTVPLGADYVDFTTREPFGVSLQIIPWNYPLQIGCRGIAPALAAGNCVVVKPAEEAPLSMLELGRIAQDVGLEPGVFNVVTGLGEEAGAALARHPGVDQITFTGSLETGTAVMRAAAENVVPVVLELGGKCPNIVFSDANLEEAVPVIARALIQNAGQTCSAASRILVASSLRDALVAQVVATLRDVSIGKGIDDPDMGPLISEAQLERVDRMVKDAVRDGSSLPLGGVRLEGASGGFFFAPTVVTDASPASAIATHEVFGPVVTVLTFEADDERAAVELANAPAGGLVAGVWTRDIRRALRVAASLKVGQVFVNGYGAAGGVELPFGGFGRSGFGREKGVEGLNSYLQTKNVCIPLADA
jgi:acyl-CoA reductase-like NAD-dependent aldehyde dehydrogenase